MFNFIDLFFKNRPTDSTLSLAMIIAEEIPDNSIARKINYCQREIHESPGGDIVLARNCRKSNQPRQKENKWN